MIFLLKRVFLTKNCKSVSLNWSPVGAQFLYEGSETILVQTGAQGTACVLSFLNLTADLRDAFEKNVTFVTLRLTF